MYISRILEKKARLLIRRFPILAITGPRQSGKTTLARHLFPNWKYVSLEALDNRRYARSDPRGFLEEYSGKVVIDEVQTVPELFSYLQEWVDQKKRPGQYILTGSQNFLLHKHISQSLAGRVALLTLLPLSLEEMKLAKINLKEYTSQLFQGAYPRIYVDPKAPPLDWYRNYVLTYVERDIRQIKNIPDISTFEQFVRICAGRVGQLLNLSSMAHDLGITHNTAKAWISVLEASYLVFLLQPHHQRHKTRLVKMPKLYFYDTGLVCSLLGIENAQQLRTYPIRGNLFENLVISELVKYRVHRGLSANLYFWRDKLGREVDCIFETANQLLPIEVKSGKTVNNEYFKDLTYWQQLSKDRNKTGFVIYGGDMAQKRNNAQVISWKNPEQVFE